jgi:hypothetical protein
MREWLDMKRMNPIGRAVIATSLVACLLTGVGCDEQLAGELVTLSGGYLGDVVSTVVIHGLEDALNLEAADSDSGGADEHDSSALHDHEH